MENCITTGCEVWSEFFLSDTGLVHMLALCSDTLSAHETNVLKAIGNAAVANSYVKPHQVDQVIQMVKTALTRSSGGAD